MLLIIIIIVIVIIIIILINLMSALFSASICFLHVYLP